MNDQERGWLAGMFDGEGCVAITPSGKSFSPQVSVSTSDPQTKDLLVRLLEELGGRPAVYKQKTRDPSKHRQNWHVRVRSIESCLNVARVMKVAAVTKRQHWIVVGNWCSSRLENKGKPYSESEIDLAKQSQELNRKGPR